MMTSARDAFLVRTATVPSDPQVRTRKDGSNVLIARSPLRFVNSADEPLEILVHADAPAPPVTSSTRQRGGGTQKGHWGVPKHQHQHAYMPQQRMRAEVHGPVRPGGVWVVPLSLVVQVTAAAVLL
eukprot:139595-Pleurochrysis_carterae.AAC.2